MKEIKNKKHEASEYIKIKIYLLSKNKIITLIKREFHVVNNLIIKTFIKIDIIKLKDIILNL